MLDALLYALGQITLGLLIALALMGFAYGVYLLGRWFDPNQDNSNRAEMPRAGAWQYVGDNEYNTDQFFPKIEEFRNDFA